MPACQGKLSDGKPCPKSVDEGQTYCQWHDPEDESWREIYDRLSKSTPEEKTDIVLCLIEDHPEYELVLPEREGVQPNLQHVDLSRETLGKRIVAIKSAHWWNDIFRGVNLFSANLQGAFLESANLQGAILVHANLQNASLWSANLQDAYLMDVNLHGADLWFANLQGADLVRANFQGADLSYANLQGANLGGANLQIADLRNANLQGVDLFHVQDITNVHISDAWLERTRLRQDQLGGAIGEELKGYYAASKRGYLALKQNFDDLGDYDAASWAYRKERRMEKFEAWELGQAALKERKWGEALASYFKFASDLIVEYLCDYGESIWRVIGWMAVLFFVVGPLLFSAIGGFFWPGNLLEDYSALPSPWHQFWYRYILYLLYTLDALTTASFSGLQPANTAVKLASGFFSIAGIFLVGLLGFVAGNRIRRS